MEITERVILSLIKFLENNNDTLGAKSINRITPKEKDLPAIIIREGTSSYKDIEIGSRLYKRQITLYIEIFANNDAERLTLKDKVISLLRKNSIPIYDISAGEGEYVFGEPTDYMNVIDMTDYRIRLGEDLANLDLIDRHRHLINVTFDIGKIE